MKLIQYLVSIYHLQHRIQTLQHGGLTKRLILKQVLGRMQGIKQKNVSNTIGNNEINFVKESNESPLLKFVRDEMQMKANYQPIVIKMLLENEDKGFTVSYDDIKKKFDDLNFDDERWEEGERDKGSFGSTLDSLRGSKLSEFVSFAKGTTGTARLDSDKVHSRDIPEILKICGQEIARWHLEHIVEDDYNLWRMPPGRADEKYPYERKFLESNTIGVGWGRIGDDIVKKRMTKDQTVELFRKKYPTKGKDKNSPQPFTNFTHEIKPKDIIVLIKKKTIVDFVIVVGPYRYEKNPSIDIPDNAKSYSHRRDVVWLNRGSLPVSEVAEPSRISTCDRVKDVQRKEEYINVLLEEESESRDYWAVKTGFKELPTWQMLLSSKKILHKGLDIDLSEFYDEDGKYKHELVKGEKVSQELKDEIKRKDSKAKKHQTVSWHATDFKKIYEHQEK